MIVLIDVVFEIKDVKREDIEKALSKAIDFMAQCTYCPIEYSSYCTEKDCKEHLLKWLLGKKL